MIARLLHPVLNDYVSQFPVIFLTGPRQSGKSTLEKTLVGWSYVNLEDPDQRNLATNEPALFLAQLGEKAIIDEAQHVPELFSHIQLIVDENPQRKFLLTGSQNFLMLEKITQSLAGRTGILQLLPFSMDELAYVGKLPALETYLWKGSYPRIYDQNIDPKAFYNGYLNTYVERDVRSIRNIGDLATFRRFLGLCAGRIGQLLNMNALATETGTSVNTIKHWLSVLEASYVIYLLQPYHKNFNKRITKSPKLYFYDTGLACRLLLINKPEELLNHFARVQIFESLVITEIRKSLLNAGEMPHLYFWRDSHGHEVDLLIDQGATITAVEIKSGKNPSLNYLKGLKYWQELTSESAETSKVVYAGEQQMRTGHGDLVPWMKVVDLVSK
ncbi:MAG: ATP-binding protein [Bacteroidia bacterium]